MQAASLCRCICGTGKKDLVDTTGRSSLGSLDLDGLEEVDEPPFHPPPLVTGRLAYSVVADQPLRGAPIREGELWYLSAEEKVEPVKVSLHVNGFSFVHSGREVRVSLSPFSLVRNCKFQSSYCNINLADIKIFKVSLFTQNLCYYYGVRSEDDQFAEEERSRWVVDISRVMRLVTQSLFPPFNISCEPIAALASTHTRLMAGYLVHHDDTACASVLYCELHPHCEDQAKLVLYESELCQVLVTDICFSDCSMCSEKVGINCSCFCIEDHQFSTRTMPERKLWLRAISNVKVKLQNRAPTPTKDELRHYRNSIKDYLGTLKPQIDVHAPMDALLQRSLRGQRSRKNGRHDRCERRIDSRGLGTLPPMPMEPLKAAVEEAVADTGRAATKAAAEAAAAEAAAAGEGAEDARVDTDEAATKAAAEAAAAEAAAAGEEAMEAEEAESKKNNVSPEDAERAELAAEMRALETSMQTPPPPRRLQASPTQTTPDTSTVPAHCTPDSSWSVPRSGHSGRSDRSNRSGRNARSPPALHFGRIVPTPQELPVPGDG